MHTTLVFLILSTEQWDGSVMIRSLSLWLLKGLLVVMAILLPLVFPDSHLWYVISGTVTGLVVSLVLVYTEAANGVFAQMFGDGRELQLHGHVARVVATWLVLLLLLIPMFFGYPPTLSFALAGGMLGGIALAEVLWVRVRG